MLYAPLDLPRVHPLDAPTTHPSVQASARAWLTAYDLAHLFGFAETTAIRPADADRAVEAWRCASDDEPRFELTASGGPRDPGRSMPDPAWLLVDHVDRYTEGVYTPPAVQLALVEGRLPSGDTRGARWTWPSMSGRTGYARPAPSPGSTRLV